MSSRVFDPEYPLPLGLYHPSLLQVRLYPQGRLGFLMWLPSTLSRSIEPTPTQQF